MLAAQISQYGPAENIKVVEVDRPVVSPGMVLVKVHASSINPWDTFVRSGRAQKFMKLDLPVTLGGDIAGIVTEIGEGVEELIVGDEVFGEAGVPQGSGAFAEYALVKQSSVSLKPKSLSFVESAAIRLTGLSAIGAIEEHLKLRKGQKVLIHGGSGGIGSIAIQIAKRLGAYVATTASGNGLNFVRKLGADEVIDYKNQEFDKLISGYDAVFDTVAGETYKRSFAVLEKGGRIVSMNEQPDHNLAKQYSVTAEFQATKTTPESLKRLARLADEGAVKVTVDQVFALDEIVDAFKAWESGGIKGKVGIKIVN